MHGRTIITHRPFQKSLPYKEEVMFLFIMDQCCKEHMVLEVSSKVLLECHAVTERNWKIRLDSSSFLRTSTLMLRNIAQPLFELISLLLCGRSQIF